MQRDYVRWFSPSLGRDMEMLTFGYQGAPVVMFPTSMGRFYENEDMGMIGALADKIDGGFIQVYCVDSVDSESWYNWGASGGWRTGRHNAYDNYLLHEVVPFIRSRNSNGYIVSTGCSFGAYHAVNFAFRHPWEVHKVVAMSGRYNMRPYVGDYYDDNLYYNSPMDFIGGMQDGDYKERLKLQEIYLMTGWGDLPVCLDETRHLHDLLDLKGVGNTLEIWDNYKHDWPDWKLQTRKHI